MGSTSSSAVSAGQTATAAQLNNLRTDVLSGHDHDGTHGDGTVSATAFDGAATVSANWAFTGTVTVGVDDTGKDVKFFGATSGQYVLWDESADELVLAGDTKLSFHDAAGDENIIASANGHLEINSGTTLDITAPTVDLNSSTEFNIDTAAYDLNASGAVTVDAAGVSIDSSSASNLTTSGGALTITSAAAATWSTAAGALTVNGTGGVNLQEGGATIIGISDSRVLATTNTASIDMDATGAIQVNSSGGALSVGNDNIDQTVNIATAGTRTLNLGINDGTDATTLAIKGNSTNTGTITVGTDGTGYDVKLFGDTSGAYMLWDESADDLILAGAANLSVTNTTNSTSTGTGSIHTQGGLGVTLDCYFGDDIFLSSGAVFNWNSGDVTLTHSSNKLTLGGSNSLELSDDDSADKSIVVEQQGTGQAAIFLAKIGASNSNNAGLQMYQGSGNGSANNHRYDVTYDGGNAHFNIYSSDTDGSATGADVLRIPDGNLTVDGNSTFDDNAFDYVCQSCGKNSADKFECCGPVEWQDDVQLMAQAVRKDPDALEALHRQGVVRIYDDGQLFISMNRSPWYIMSGMVQLLNRIKELERKVALNGA